MKGTEDQDKKKGKQEEFYILKVVDKAKFQKKERTICMKYVRNMIHIDHPTIATFSNFFMSSDQFYFVSKLRLKSGYHREFKN